MDPHTFRALLSVGLVLALTVGSGPARAQEAEDPPRAFDFDDSHEYPEFPEPPADLPRERMEIVFDLVSRSRTLAVEPHVPFEFLVVAHHSRVAVRGWEASVQIDPRITVVGREVQGLDVMPAPDDYMIGIKPADCLYGDTIVLVKYTAMVVEPGLTDLTLGLAPISRSSFEPPSPGYLVCTPDHDLRDYEWCELCAVVNPVQKRPEGEERPSFLDPVKGKLR